MSTTTEKLRRSQGKCIRCGEQPMPGRSRCEECRDIENARIHAWRAKRKKLEVCIDCGVSVDQCVRCQSCSDRTNGYDKRRTPANRVRIAAQRARRQRERIEARALRAEQRLAAQAMALVELKKPRPRQLSFRFKRKKEVQRFGVDFLIRKRHARGLAEFGQKAPESDCLPGSPEHTKMQDRRSARVKRAYKLLRITPITVATPEWIEADRRDELQMLSDMALMSRLR